MEGTNTYDYPPPRFHQGPPIRNGHYDHPYNERTSSPYQQGLPTNFMTQKQWHQHVANGYRPNRKVLSCGPCNRTFFNQQRLDEHLKDHVECPFPECKLSAHIKVIDQHINNQHMLVNFAALQIDDETWIAERKKRFPTARRAELRRAQQMEKLKRGEKLGMSKKPFAKNNVDRGFKRGRRGDKIPHKKDRTVVSDVKDGDATGDKEVTKQRELAPSHVTKDKLISEESTSGQFSRQKRPRFERPSRPTIEVDLYDSDKEPLGVPPFKGTKQFYESTGEMNYFSSTHLTKDSPPKDFVISDDEEWESEQKGEGEGKIVLSGALGSLMGTYSDSEDSEGDDAALPAAKSNVAISLPIKQKSNMPTEQKQNKSDIAKDKQKAEGQSKSVEVPVHRSRKRHRTHAKNKKPTKFPRRPRRRKTLLERLLQADIIHERNLILQCARFIVENNFFEKEDPKEMDVEQLGIQKKEADMKNSLQKPQDSTVTEQITSFQAVSSCGDDVSTKKPDSTFEFGCTSKSDLASDNVIAVSGETEKSSILDCNSMGNSVTESKRKNHSVDDCDAQSDSTLEECENKPGAINGNMAVDSDAKSGKSAIDCSVTKNPTLEYNRIAIECTIPGDFA